MASKPSRGRFGRLGALVRILFFISLAVGGLGIGFVGALVAAYSRDLPDVERLRTYQPSGTTRIFASNGELIATLFKENRTWVPLKDVPECMRQAMVASEDSRFYQHPGVDPVGIVRALWWAVRSRGTRQGASTITMQLARSVFLNTDVTARRKIQEVLISIQLERKFSKDELLEFYLNQIYFGSGAYGVEAASGTYFGKRARQLDLAESAMLVGTVPAPSDYSPLVNPKVARERQLLVLRRMVDCGFIKPDQAKKAESQRVKLARQRKDQFVLKMPYFTTWLLRNLSKKYGDDRLYGGDGGLKIYTTVDPTLQEAAQEAVNWGMTGPGQGRNVHQGALVAIEPRTGYVKAMVGGTGWSDQSQFNRAWQAQRSAGSSFKIFVYAAALQEGFTPDSVVPDVPVSLKAGPGDWWSPKNSDGRFMGSIPLRTALQHSRNTVSAQLVEKLGPGKVIDLAYKMGVRGHIDPNLSIALGAASVSPLEMASALAVVANDGQRAEPVAIKWILDAEGKTLEDHRHPESKELISPITAFAMTEMLENAVNAGTGYAARLSAQPAAGKTGTTDSHRDAWFCGFTPELAAAVWVGNDDNSQMWGTFGGDVPAPIWKRFMDAALKGKAVKHFGADGQGQVSVYMCAENGLRATAICPKTVQKTFPWRGVPQHFCGTHVFTGTRSVARSGGPQASPSASPDPEAEGQDAEPVPTATPEEGMGEEGSPSSPTPGPGAEEPPPPAATPTSPETAPPPGHASPSGPVHPPGSPPPPRPTPREEPPAVDPPRPTPGDARRDPPRPTPGNTRPEAPRPTPQGPARRDPGPPAPAATPAE